LEFAENGEDASLTYNILPSPTYVAAKEFFIGEVKRVT